MKKDLMQAVQIIEKFSKEGDVINIDGHTKNIFYTIGYWGIRKAQKELYGPNSRWQDTHTMMKFNNSTISKILKNNEKVQTILENNKKPWKKVFSVEPPKATFITTEEFALEHITVYRYTKKKFYSEDIKILLEATIPILLTQYDFGQLINIAVNQILGYPYDEKVLWFDFGCKMKVCSVGVGAIIQKWRKTLEAQEKPVPPRLFSKLNSHYWSKEFIEEFTKNGSRWNIENYYPAIFANSQYYDNEFKLILEMNKGEIVYSAE